MKKSILMIAAASVALSIAAAVPKSNHICILGSCAGTEPVPGRRHSAWTLQCNGKLYQFEAGEGCAYTAHTNGIDLTQLQAVFISHYHMDHNGGLPHIFYVRNKMAARFRKTLLAKPLPIYTAYPQQVNAVLDFLSSCSLNKKDFRKNNTASIHQIKDGTIFDDGTIKIEAIHNMHVGGMQNGLWRSFSFKINAAGKKIVFSGDVRNVHELDKFLTDCDILMIETGHHKPWEIAETIRKNSRWQVRKLIFVHHGRDLLNNPQESMHKTNQAWGKEAEYAFDGMIIEL
jgi:ribonuclease BN (tRNA processing enzyme)